MPCEYDSRCGVMTFRIPIMILYINKTLVCLLSRELFTPPYWGWYTPLLTLTHTPKLCSPIGGVCTVQVVYSYTA